MSPRPRAPTAPPPAAPRRYREPDIDIAESDGQPSSRRTTLAAGALVPFPEPYGYGKYYRPWGDTSFARYHRTWQRTLSPADIPSDDLVSMEYTTNVALGVGPFARVTFERGTMPTCNGGRVPVGARIDPFRRDTLYLRGARPLNKIRTEVRDSPGARTERCARSHSSTKGLQSKR